jgi:probable F420-dependent oxidoreductase
MTMLTKTFGIAARNFVGYPDMPDARKLVEYGVRVEELGYDSVWVWDHMLLGVDPNFPIIDSLTALTGIAARTSKIKMGTGILVLPLRNPVALAKQLSSMDQLSNGRLVMGMAAGWYKREFDAMGLPFSKRGKIMDQNLEIMRRLWTEAQVTGQYSIADQETGIQLNYNLSKAVMYPKPAQSPLPILIGGYADAALKRAGVAGDGWLTYFYRAEDFKKSWDKVIGFAKEAGKDPSTVMNASQLPIMVGASKDAVREEMMDWLNKEWDFPAHSDCSRESAIMGSVDDCVEQLRVHIEAGVQKIIFVPYKYQMEQIEMIAREIIPRLKAL